MVPLNNISWVRQIALIVAGLLLTTVVFAQTSSKQPSDGSFVDLDVGVHSPPPANQSSRDPEATGEDEQQETDKRRVSPRRPVSLNTPVQKPRAVSKPQEVRSRVPVQRP